MMTKNRPHMSYFNVIPSGISSCQENYELLDINSVDIPNAYSKIISPKPDSQTLYASSFVG